MGAEFVKVFLNPSAGTSRSKKITEKDLENLFTAEGLRACVHLLTETDCLKMLIDEAEAQGCTTIVSAGGDGTLFSIASEMIGRDTPLGILPLGTFNNTARNLNIPLEPGDAVKRICHGTVKKIDVGKSSENHYFLEAAGAGIDAALFPIGEDIKSGRLHRLGEAFRIVFSYRPHRVTLDLTDRQGTEFHLKTRAIWILVANGMHYGSNIQVAPEAIIDDGLLTVKITHHFSTMDMLRLFLAVAFPVTPASPKVSTYEVTSIRMKCRSRIPFHADGKKVGHLPIGFEVIPHALKVIV